MLEVIAKDQTRLDSVLKLLFSHISPSTGDNFTCARAKVNETQVIQQAFQPSQSGGCEALTQSLLCGFVHQKSRFSDKAVRVLVSKKFNSKAAAVLAQFVKENCIASSAAWNTTCTDTL